MANTEAPNPWERRYARRATGSSNADWTSPEMRTSSLGPTAGWSGAGTETLPWAAVHRLPIRTFCTLTTKNRRRPLDSGGDPTCPWIAAASSTQVGTRISGRGSWRQAPKAAAAMTNTAGAVSRRPPPRVTTATAANATTSGTHQPNAAPARRLEPVVIPVTGSPSRAAVGLPPFGPRSLGCSRGHPPRRTVRPGCGNRRSAGPARAQCRAGCRAPRRSPG